MLGKADFVNLLSEHNEITKKDATEMYDSVFGTLAEVVSEGSEVAITGLGRVKIANRPARVAHNPKTKDKIKVPAKKVSKFQFGKNIKEVVAGL